MLSRSIAIPVSLGLTSAVAESRLRYDSAGNPALDKARRSSRIDLLQAGIIAAGLRALSLLEPAPVGGRLFKVGA